MNARYFLMLGNLPMRISSILLAGLLSGCASQEPSSTFYHQSGQVAQMVRCPQGEYELCLKQMSDACNNSGYTVQEKIRQIKSGIWGDSAEILMVAQCKSTLSALQ